MFRSKTTRQPTAFADGEGSSLSNVVAAIQALEEAEKRSEASAAPVRDVPAPADDAPVVDATPSAPTSQDSLAELFGRLDEAVRTGTHDSGASAADFLAEHAEILRSTREAQREAEEMLASARQVRAAAAEQAGDVFGAGTLFRRRQHQRAPGAQGRDFLPQLRQRTRAEHDPPGLAVVDEAFHAAPSRPAARSTALMIAA